MLKFLLVLSAFTVLLAFLLQKMKPKSGAAETSVSVSENEIANKDEPFELAIRFEELPALTTVDESRLVEITDKQLLAKIDNAIPGTMQVLSNSGTAKSAQQFVKEARNLYRVVIPEGAALDPSRSMAGASRATYRDAANRIAGQANLVRVDPTAAKTIAVLNLANAVANAASMVVGQYYMAQISNQLENITDGLEKISDFQNNEFKGKIYALVAEVQKGAAFQLETMENNDIRNRELLHLRNLEHECAELLGQANLTIQGIAEKSNIDYEKYEKLVGEAQMWFQYQQVLLNVMHNIADLTYTLNLGAISRENSFALFTPYENQAVEAKERLIDWNSSICYKLKIDVDKRRRELQGFFGKAKVIYKAPFKKDWDYKPISKQTAHIIKTQMSENCESDGRTDDLFCEAVELIAKDGRLYYLPQSNKSAQ